jgi:hypothetical protein
MRTLAWLTLLAAALFFGAPENAFAHPNHVHSVQSASAESVTPIADHVIHTDEFVSAADLHKEKCQHGHDEGDCGVCGACTASASVALATTDTVTREMRVRGEGLPLVVAYRVRQTVLDLSRPPKFFA